MNQKNFTDALGRKIVIKIDDEHISFYYLDAMIRQNEWIAQQEESGDEITDEDKVIDTFYWIDKQHWISDYTQRQDREDNFHLHMRKKTWFTDEMYDFMNESCEL